MSAPGVGQPSGQIVPQIGPSVGGVVDSVRNQSGARILAIVLILAILLLRGVFSGRLPLVWDAIWGPIKPLGEGHTTVTLPSVTSTTPAAPATPGH